MDLPTTKAGLRKAILAARSLISPDQVGKKSSSIIKRLEKLEPLRQARVIMAYSSIRNEVDLWPYLEEMLGQGKTILLPRVEGDKMLAVPFEGRDRCRISSFGIQEPCGSELPMEKIEAVLVPGVAFDRNGHRLGYGRGFYDRFLPGLSASVFRCGIAYDFQIVDSVFPEENDVPMHWIVSDQLELVVQRNWGTE
ncbi:MAG: 5-formyltetrahydrofolate cyclo-ligase [Syntrophomonadaceae bacterium]